MMQTMQHLGLVLFLGILLSGCASHPDTMQAAYVSPLKYHDYDCQQLSLEMHRVERRTIKLYSRLKAKRTADNWRMGVGLTFFWPVLFMLEGGDGPDANEYAQLQGDSEALRKSAVQRKCFFKHQTPQEVMESYENAGQSHSHELKRSSSTELTPSGTQPKLTELEKKRRAVEEEERRYQERNKD